LVIVFNKDIVTYRHILYRRIS